MSDYTYTDPRASTQPSPRADLRAAHQARRRRARRACLIRGCAIPTVLLLILLLMSSVYFFWPGRTNVLVLGIDRPPEGTWLGRSDTNILVTFIPLQPYVGMLSIPRDLWVAIPGVGENRINTAHFFAEGEQPGQGPYTAVETVRSNFGVDVDYYVRIRFEGFQEIVDAMGGLDINLDQEMAGFPPGRHHLNGEQALAFVRDRENTDDFFRMNQGQFFFKSVMKQAIRPLSWPRIPAMFGAINRSVETDLPVWLWPRLGFALLRVGPEGIDSRTVSREMTTPYVTGEGAQVLLPIWERINPMLLEIFEQ